MSAVPFGPGIDIWRSCRFIGSLMRSLCLLPGGLRRFVPCSIGARLRHIGWEKCGHGLTSRPRESASELFLNELLSLFRYLSRSGRALLNGTLPLRYCAARFSGHVVDLVTDAVLEASVDGAGQEVHWVRGSGPGRKRIRRNRKTPAHLAGFRVQSRPRVWKRLRLVGYSRVSIPHHKRRRGDQDDGRYNPAQVRTGVG